MVNLAQNIHLDFFIQVAAGSKIELTFVDFILEDHSSCAYDYVQGIKINFKIYIKNDFNYFLTLDLNDLLVCTIN